MASTRGHPVLIDTLRRIVNLALLPPDNSKPLSVMERTGPGPFTDAVFRYLRIKWGLRWADLRNLHDDGWRRYDVENGLWGDTKVLSITGFSPGIGLVFIISSCCAISAETTICLPGRWVVVIPLRPPQWPVTDLQEVGETN